MSLAHARQLVQGAIAAAYDGATRPYGHGDRWGEASTAQVAFIAKAAEYVLRALADTKRHERSAKRHGD